MMNEKNVSDEGLFATAIEGVVNKGLNPIRIKSIAIQNYKSIIYKEYVLEGKSLFLKGKNGLGKTNVLEAIYWALSGVLFDGTGKADRMEIKPKDSTPETETSVKLVFTGGNDFVLEKKLADKYDSKGNYKGTETSILINGTPIGLRDGQERLLDLLGLEHMVKAFKKDPNLNAIDIMALVYNPQTITQMDYKQLRALIISIIGDVSFEETVKERMDYYQAVAIAWKENGGTLDDLKSATKNAIHDKNSGLENAVMRTEAVLKEYEREANVELNMEEIKVAKEKIDELDKQIREVKNEMVGGEEAINANYNAKLNAKELELSNLKLQLTKEHQERIAKLTDNSIDNEINEKRQSLSRIRDEKNGLNETINSLNGKKTVIEQTIIGKSSELSRERNYLEGYRESYKKLDKPSDDVTYTCPHCNKPFGVSETNEYKFHVSEQKKKVIHDGNTCKERVKALEKGIEELNEDKEGILKQILKLQNERTQLDTNITSIQSDIQALETKRTQQRANLPTLMIDEDANFKRIKGEMDSLNVEKHEALNNLMAHKKELDVKLYHLENERIEHAKVTEKEAIINNNRKQAELKRKELGVVQNKLQEKKELNILIKTLERETYAKLDSKLESVFGKDFTFQLYKENVSNGEYDTRMCEMYVKDSHDKYVNITRINTGLYPIRWAEFIGIVKKHYNVPSTLVLIDEVSSLDQEHRNLLMGFGEQVLATSVSESTTIQEDIE